MEPTSRATSGAHLDNDDAVFISCAAMFTMAIVFIASSFDNPLSLRMMVPNEMMRQNSATVIEMTTVIPATPAPELTIEQELDAVGEMLGVSASTPTPAVKK